MKPFLTLLSLFTLFVLTSCQKDSFQTKIDYPVLPETSYDYTPKWGGMHSHMAGQDLGITDAGATLGRVLFYDKILSIDNTVSCGSCHHQDIGFSDQARVSQGIDHQVTDRNAPSISNLYDDNLLFWDGRSTNLNDLVLQPVRNHKEMGMENMDFLVTKIKAAPYYQELFTKAYGDAEVTSTRVADAMAQFVRSMIGCDSEMDRQFNSGQPLSTQAEEGRNIFFGKGTCYNCHSGPDFNDRGGFFDPFFPPNGGGFGWAQDIADIGLDEAYIDVGMGVFDPKLVGVFKIPSLRNVAMTAPYMHDGRFATLEEVVNHYNNDIKKSPNLDNVFKSWDTGDAIKLGLSEGEVSSVVAFLHSLTDDNYMNDERFADPFTK
ncbi:MAG: cytochrome-c peroxidase [Saprospiraceae bacterium]|nr:cytochrome-c peroxidase [Candidatus Opimibacter iunctus]